MSFVLVAVMECSHCIKAQCGHTSSEHVYVVQFVFLNLFISYREIRHGRYS